MEANFERGIRSKDIQLYRSIRKYQQGIGQDPKEMCRTLDRIQIIGPRSPKLAGNAGCIPRSHKSWGENSWGKNGSLIGAFDGRKT